MRIDEPVLIDTSALLATFNPRDVEHDVCQSVAVALPLGKAYVCWPVVTEAFYLLRNHTKLRTEFLASIAAGEFTLLHLTSDDIHGVQSVVDKYHDQEVDLADAALVHLADREEIRTVFTLDRRHFRLFTRAGGDTFRLLPDDFETED